MRTLTPPRRLRLAQWLAAAAVAVTTAAGMTVLGASPAAAVETNTWYRIVNDQTGLAVSIQNGSTTTGAISVLATASTATSQQFRFVDSGGGYVETTFTGSSIGVKLRNTIDMYYSIDGGAETWMRAVSGNVTVRTGLSGTHTIRIGFREKAGSYTGDPAFGGFILAGGGATSTTSRPANFIEFIGDSITVGQPNGNRPFTAFGYMVGDNLNAGHTQVAQGGACLVSTADGCWGMMDWFRRTSMASTGDDWNFSRYQATAVVINLGTNDVGHGVSTATFQQQYIVMLQRVRAAYPNAHIFAMETFRGRYSPETLAAVNARVSAGDAKVHFVDTTGWLPDAADLVDSVHPSDAGHLKIANRLTPIIDQYI